MRNLKRKERAWMTKVTHEERYIRPCEKKLIDANRAYWADTSNAACGEEWIYTYHTVQGLFEFAVHEGVVAKGLQAKEKLPLAAISYEDGSCKLWDELDDSFGIQVHLHVHSEELKGTLANGRAAKAAKRYADATYGNKEELLKIQYRGIFCGDVLYDEITRKKSNVTYDCFAGGLDTYYHHIWTAFTLIEWAYATFRKRKPKYLITAEYVGLQALICSVACMFGARLLFVDNMRAGTAVRVFPSTVREQRLTTAEILRCRILESLKNMDKTAVYEDLFIYTIENSPQQKWLQELGVENGKKNVFIMLHVLGDVPRESYRQNVYIGYNEWYLDTLSIIKQIPDVNWIIKDHPFSDMYGQGDYVRAVFEENKTSNMYWCDKTISGMQIKEAADCVITCAGDVGIEYWAYGIPTITLAETYYYEQGISYHMNSRKEYEHVLRHLEGLERPAPESMQRARNYLAAYKNEQERADAFTKLLFCSRKEQINNAKTADFEDTFSRVRYIFCKGYMELLHDQKIRSSEVYKLERILDL